METMSWFLYSVLQGITEAFPVSSSGHIELISRLEHINPDKGLLASLHLGSFFGLLLYFRHDVVRLFHGALALAQGRFSTPSCQLLIKLGLASIPLVGAAAILHFFHVNEDNFSHIILMQITFALALYAADIWGEKRHERKPRDNVSPFEALFIGTAQIAAIIPGASRLGVCLTAGRLLGLSRVDAAHFGFLMALPALGGALLLHSRTWFTSAMSLSFGTFLAGVGLAGALTFWGVGIFMRWIERGSFMPFVLYRIAFAAVVGIALWMKYI